jgi:hypothetical protein
MKTGVVMDMDESLLTVLTPDGEFLHAKKQDRPYTIGEEISFFPLETVARKRFISNFGLKHVLTLSAALLITFGSLFPMYQSNQAYAYMSIDVNPSIELALNKKMQVVELTAFNKEGKEIISHLEDWKKQDVTKITETIIAEMGKEGYLNNNKQLIISTVKTEAAEKEIEKQLEANIKEIEATATQQQLELTVVSGTEQDLEKAHQLGLTTGKYQTKSLNKGNGKEKTNVKKESMRESQPGVKVPPGQLKKQEPANAQADNGAVATTPPQAGNEQNNQVGNSIPPGQQKKMEQQQPGKQNKGQLKKQQNKNTSPGQDKKQSQNKNSNNKYK